MAVYDLLAFHSNGEPIVSLIILKSTLSGDHKILPAHQSPLCSINENDCPKVRIALGLPLDNIHHHALSGLTHLASIKKTRELTAPVDRLRQIISDVDSDSRYWQNLHPTGVSMVNDRRLSYELQKKVD